MCLNNHFDHLGPRTFAFHRAKLVVENGPWHDASPLCSLLFPGPGSECHGNSQSSIAARNGDGGGDDDDDDDDDDDGGDDGDETRMNTINKYLTNSLIISQCLLKSVKSPRARHP